MLNLKVILNFKPSIGVVLDVAVVLATGAAINKGLNNAPPSNKPGNNTKGSFMR